MTKLGIQSALALLVALASTWGVQAQQISILQRTKSILTPGTASETQPNLTLPNIRFHQSATPPNEARRQRRQLTPEMRSLLAPPSLQPTQHPASSAPQAGNRVTYAQAYSTDAQPSPSFHQDPTVNSAVNTVGFSTGPAAKYGFNPYSPSPNGTIQQTGGDEILRRWGPPQTSETRATNSFSQISTSDFAELKKAVPLDTVQDPEDPSDPLPTLPQQQEETDTQPRPLPDDLRPPTELPIPPIDSNPQIPDTNPQNPGTEDGQGNVVYSDRALPGRQSYPGPTAKHQPPFIQGNPVPTNPRQTIYPPREPKVNQPNINPIPQYQPGYPLPPTVYPQEQRIYPESGPVYPILPNTGSSGSVFYPPPESTGNYQPIISQSPPISVEQTQSESCCDSRGWRPQLALGVDPKSPKFDPCCEPLFYLAAFGGISNADDLDGGLPPVGTTNATFNLDGGANFGLVFGQFQGRNLRTEFEYAFRHNDVESIVLTENTGAGLNLTSFNLAGEIKAHSGMTNLVWEFNNPMGRFIRPYVGTGVGFVFMDVNASQAGRDVLVAGQDGNSSFAYQWFAGVNTQLSNELDIFLEYRYFYADDLRLQTDLVNVNGGAGTISSSFDYSTTNVNFGLRFKF